MAAAEARGEGHASKTWLGGAVGPPTTARCDERAHTNAHDAETHMEQREKKPRDSIKDRTALALVSERVALMPMRRDR